MEIKKLIVEGKYEIAGRGLVYTISLKDNGISPMREDFNKDLMGKTVIINDIKYVVKGIEAFAAGMGFVHNKVGLLVKPLI